MIKKYLGRASELTLARLEEASRQLAAISSRTAQDAGGALDRGQRRMSSSAQTSPGGRSVSQPLPDTGASLSEMELTTKLHAPRLRSQLVARDHLVRRLQQASAAALTVISAPAGFGKTTLLVQWLAECGMASAWLSLEPQDDEPVRFLSYLIAALQTLDPAIGMSARSLLFSPRLASSLSLETVLTVLTNDLASRQDKEMVLILDDYHVLAAEPIQRAMTFLVEHCPPQLRLVLATRADPPLPLARLRARGQLSELRAAQLQFETSEADTFLSEVMGLHLSPEGVAVLQKRTEGWIAGLHLAALSLQGRSDVEPFLTDFTGSHRHITDYLVEEVLSRQTEEVQSFLLHTSLLERLCGPLCDVVAERSGSEVLLEALERANLFLVPLDEQRRWYRYHHLFADLLRARLRRRLGGQGMAALYMKASLWYEQNDLPMEAVGAALAAGDGGRAADILEPLSLPMIVRLQHAELRRWIEQLPREEWFKRPLLCTSYAIALFITGAADTYRVPLQQAERLLEVAGNDYALGRFSMIRALAASLRGDALEGIRYGQKALTLLTEYDQVARTASISAVVEGYRRTGNVSTAWQMLSEAPPFDAPIGQLFGLAAQSILRARLLVMQGKLRQAAESYQAMLGSVSERHELAMETLLSLAELAWEANELETAQGYLERMMMLAREMGTELRPPRAALLHARIRAAQGELAEAAFAAAVLQAQQSDHQHLPAEAQAHQVRWWLRQGKLEAVAAWYTTAAGILDAPADYQQEQVALTLVRVLIAQDEASAALELLMAFRELARSQGRTGSEIEILMLTALAYHAQSKSDQALQILQQALLLAEPEGYVRLFVDEGAPMAVLLRLLLAHWKSKRGRDYIQRLLALLEPAAAKSTTTPHTAQEAELPVLLEPLSQRERKVLRLLAAGLSNPEIANELVVSLNTVKTQVQSLYRKLQVSSRQEAVATARRLQLL
jgi:LuxR family maltose regulon positive regulatory protein